MQSVIYDANRKGVSNEITLVQCENKRKITEDKLNNLRVKLAALLQKLQLVSDETVFQWEGYTLWKEHLASFLSEHHHPFIDHGQIS